MGRSGAIGERLGTTLAYFHERGRDRINESL
jgi:hypothetical protein